jgi:hypothetical protein
VFAIINGLFIAGLDPAIQPHLKMDARAKPAHADV